MQSIVILDMLRYECEMKIGNVLVVVCRLHYMTSTNAGFCQGNMTWCHAARGRDYHWVIDLYERMNLPVISAVVRALHSSTQDRIDALRKQKTDESKHKRIRVKVARAEDQEARKKWVKRQALVHTYGGGDDGQIRGPDGQIQNPLNVRTYPSRQSRAITLQPIWPVTHRLLTKALVNLAA